MKHPGKLKIRDYTYDLPVDKIALHPLPQRDASRLLIYDHGEIQEDTYGNIDTYLPVNSLLVFNNTKVINARLRFTKTTGKIIEIFCLEPAIVENDYTGTMSAKGCVRWKCLVGGAAKWKNKPLEKIISNPDKKRVLKATLIEKRNEVFIVEFNWTPAELSFTDILKEAGETPLPPYIKRITASEDADRYQTIYAEQEGSVAAPTAGFHFTESIFNSLTKKNIGKAFITLHVGAGTFKPVKTAILQQHNMHEEWLDVNMETIKSIAANTGDIIAVGTTSLRTLETLYWLGVKIILRPGITDLCLGQWEVYEEEFSNAHISATLALDYLIKWMEKKNIKRIFTRTQLLIAPGYEFKIVNALITNFHQPQSTLLLLVAAAIGDDWKKLYDHALQNNFRFLSYGDGMLIKIK